MVTVLIIACPRALGLAIIAKANCARYTERASNISPLLRYVATPLDTGGKASSPPEKFYSFFLKDLAEAASRKLHSRPGDCLLLTDQLYLH